MMSDQQTNQWVNSAAWGSEFTVALKVAVDAPRDHRNIKVERCYRLIKELVDQSHLDGIPAKDVKVLDKVDSAKGLRLEHGLMPWLVNQVGTFIWKDEDDPLAIDIVRWAHQLGCDINQNMSENDQSSALWMATSHESLSVMKFLLEQGANANIKDEVNITPLMMCIDSYLSSKEFKINAVRLLLKHGADPNATDDDSKTAMHHLMDFLESFPNRSELVSELLMHGGEINRQDGFGDTPLHCAYLNGCANADDGNSFIESLIKSGASLHIKNSEGETALDLAMKHGDDKHKIFIKEWLLMESELKQLEEAVPKNQEASSAQAPGIRL